MHSQRDVCAEVRVRTSKIRPPTLNSVSDLWRIEENFIWSIFIHHSSRELYQSEKFFPFYFGESEKREKASEKERDKRAKEKSKEISLESSERCQWNLIIARCHPPDEILQLYTKFSNKRRVVVSVSRGAELSTSRTCWESRKVPQSAVWREL